MTVSAPDVPGFATASIVKMVPTAAVIVDGEKERSSPDAEVERKFADIAPVAKRATMTIRRTRERMQLPPTVTVGI